MTGDTVKLKKKVDQAKKLAASIGKKKKKKSGSSAGNVLVNQSGTSVGNVLINQMQIVSLILGRISYVHLTLLLSYYIISCLTVHFYLIFFIFLSDGQVIFQNG